MIFVIVLVFNGVFVYFGFINMDNFFISVIFVGVIKCELYGFDDLIVSDLKLVKIVFEFLIVLGIFMVLGLGVLF